MAKWGMWKDGVKIPLLVGEVVVIGVVTVASQFSWCGW